MSVRSFLIFFILQSFIQKLTAQCSDCGIMIQGMRIFDSAAKSFVPVAHDKDVKVYYKDSAAIVASIVIYTNELNGVATWHAEDYYFTYMDLHAKPWLKSQSFSKDSIFMNRYQNVTFYEYSAFSKDSFFVRKYMNLDTASFRTWCFFMERRKPKPQHADGQDSVVNLCDTIINQIRYKRRQTSHQFNTPNGLFRSTAIDYWRCDVQNWMKILHPEIDKEGCVGTLSYFKVFSPKPQPWLSSVYEFLPRKLTPEEIAVFDAWEKNAKKNPVLQ